MALDLKQFIPFYSIIIPHYNDVVGLKSAVESIHVQTFENWEIIIVDDGSAQASIKEIDTLAGPNVSISYHRTNKGRSAARNTGLSKAQGQYVIFLDSDDLILPFHLEEVYQVLKGADKETVFRTGMIRLDQLGIQKERIRYPHNALQHYLFNHPGIHTFIFPKKILINYKFPEAYSYWEDYHFISRILSVYKLNQIPITSVIYNAYYSWSNYYEKRELIKRIGMQIDCISDLQQNLEHLRIKFPYQKLVNRTIFSFISNQIYEGNYTIARELMKRYNPKPTSIQEWIKKQRLLIQIKPGKSIARLNPFHG